MSLCIGSADGEEGDKKKEKEEEEKKEAVNCPNRVNPYHKCTEYCRLRWGGKGGGGGQGRVGVSHCLCCEGERKGGRRW